MNQQKNLKTRVSLTFVQAIALCLLAWNLPSNLLLSQETSTVVTGRTDMLFFKGTEAPQENWRIPDAIMKDGWTVATIPFTRIPPLDGTLR